MKLHIIQIILGTVLLLVLSLIFKSGRIAVFPNSTIQDAVPETGTVESRSRILDPESLPVAYSTAGNSRETLFQRIVATPRVTFDMSNTVSTTNGSNYIIKDGYIEDPGKFFSTTTASSSRNRIQDFLDANASSSISIQYATSTGTITIISRGAGQNKNHEDVLTKLYVSKNNPISFYIDASWQMTRDIPGIIVFQNVGQYGRNRVVMTFSNNTFISTTDPVHGDFFLTYNEGAKTWLTLGNSAGDKQTLIQTVPTEYTDKGVAVFRGTTAQQTRILAFSGADFLIVNFTGLDNASIIDSFVKKVRKI